MRIFAGEWVAGVLDYAGHEGRRGDREPHGQPRSIEAAQKKVEEQHFDIRKNLLEYDEVMDHQRKQVYGFRQEILDGHNCKLRILDMIDEQIDGNVRPAPRRRLRPGVIRRVRGQPAGRRVRRVGVPRRRLRAKRHNWRRTRAEPQHPDVVQEALDENLPSDADERNGTGRRWPASSTGAAA